MELTGLSLPKLYQLQKDLEREIVSRKESDKVSLLNELQQLAAAKGFSLNEVLGLDSGRKGKVKATTSTSKAQFRNPNDATQTWSGRGRKPQWAIDWLSTGKSLEDLRV
ncbi:H-NS histone family protein [Amantichitinum ursilacus]|uniref:DNA binding protein, nucleoid-associated n=1 Tax=Amantichitinum ursilacus TaxID=857265 RepID=A0A0N0GPX4_9NEIS|nr:H-NS histone family protein [Amantichitinum ursilacus]KPC54105.1 DNA binding protein, nucleoid-associated [Amantichitinum ursilacus]